MYTSALVDELARIGVTDCVISPGSRSTPLALLIAEHQELHTYINVDERSAAFFALGAAKASRKPTVLVCTSGSAAANYLPAIVEAVYSRIPLIVITADRPHELREVGAPQAINQINMYSNFTRAYFEAALPEDSEHMVSYARSLIRRAAAAALKSPNGPVHINIPFREPLIPDLADPLLFTYGRSVHPKYIDTGHFALSNSVYERLALELCNVRKGIIVCGTQTNGDFPEGVMELADRLQFPILADPLSQLRLCGRQSEWMIDGYDAFLKNEHAVAQLKPELILRFGAMPVSKPFLQACQNHWQDVRHIIVDGGGEWRDPAGVATDMLYCDESTFCKEIVNRISTNTTADPEWNKQWIRVNKATVSALTTIRDQAGMSEGRAIYELNELLPDGSQLFIANSMPIRDVDTFIHHGYKQIELLCNRGANGIDGTISTALGAALNGKPTLLVTGDLSFFHDLNGLAALRLNELSLTIILINNDGGGIFSFLPQATAESSKKHFDRLFLTSLNMPFENAAKLYGAEYMKVENWEQYREQIMNGLSSKGIHIIEVQTNRDNNVTEHRALWKTVFQAIDPILEEL